MLHCGTLVVEESGARPQLRRACQERRVHHARQAFIRHLGALALTAIHSLLGHGVTVVVGSFSSPRFGGDLYDGTFILDAVQRAVLLACLCTIVPLVFGQLSGTNHQLRLLCPVLVPLAISVGLLANVVGWNSSPALLGVSGLAFLVQLLMLVWPVCYPNTTSSGSGTRNARLPWRSLARFDQWDWRTLREISSAAGFETPEISLVGSGENLNPLQIRYVWAVDGKPNPSVRLLWQDNRGPIDWDRVMKSVAKSDIVLTAPGWTGEFRVDRSLTTGTTSSSIGEWHETCASAGRFGYRWGDLNRSR